MILIKNATALEFLPPRVRENVDLIIEGNKIVKVGPAAGRGVSADNEIDGTGKIVFPGLVCSHHHIYSALSRGIMAPIGPTPDFMSILKNLWWRLDRAIDKELLYSSTVVACLDALRCGTTALIDHHASPNFIDASLDVVQQGFEDMGIRGATCYEVTDRHGLQGMNEGIQENRRFAQKIQREVADGKNPRLVEAYVGGHAPCTLPEEALEAMADVIRDTGRGLHLHVAEDRFDVSHSHLVYGEDIMARLDRHGLLDSRTLLVHGVHLSEAEIEILNERDGFLLHNARSNMNNTVGYNSKLSKVHNLALGSDGIGGNMLAELQAAYFAHKNDGGPWWPPDFLKALQAGNRVLERSFGASFGRLEASYMADVVVARYDAPTPLLAENLAGHLIFAASSFRPETVIVNGKILLNEGRFDAKIDVEALYARAREQAKILWGRMDEILP